MVGVFNAEFSQELTFPDSKNLEKADFVSERFLDRFAKQPKKTAAGTLSSPPPVFGIQPYLLSACML
jgi:hypothetical protein